MDKYKNKYRTDSNRLKGYDYSSAGAYFITICTKDRKHFFGEIINEEMILNDLGKMAFEEWKKTEIIRPNIIVDQFIIMPNHIHGILIIQEQKKSSEKCISVETNCNLSLPKQNGTSQTIGSIIRGFKIGVTKYIRKNKNIGTVWQSNYYDHIIRNQESFYNIQQYILDNPKKWETDIHNIP